MYSHFRMSVAAANRKLELSPLSQLFRALGDEKRLRVLALLAHGELCVCHVQSALQLTQPEASRQLGLLRVAGLVEARRAGAWVHYRLAEQLDPYRKSQLRFLVKAFARQEDLRADVARLFRSKGPEACR
ncbi:MAG: hypothetical protein NVS2B9_19160 [Myxococcales bacterium]